MATITISSTWPQDCPAAESCRRVTVRDQQLRIGVVAYGYQQLSCDSGTGDRVGCFKSSVYGVGPQIGYVLLLDEHYHAYFNAKAYVEFGEHNRPQVRTSGSRWRSRRPRRKRRSRRRRRP